MVMNTPKEVIQELHLVKCETIKDFFDIEAGKRKMMMPYWYRNNDGTMAFNFINDRTQKDPLLSDIRSGRIYIRKLGSTMKVTCIY